MVTGRVAATCRFCGISWPTFYKWRNRYEELDEEGLGDRSSGPHHGPRATMPIGISARGGCSQRILIATYCRDDHVDSVWPVGSKVLVQLREELVLPKQGNPRHLFGDFGCRTGTLLGETRNVDEDPATRPLASVEPTVESGHVVGVLLAGASTTSNVESLSVSTCASGDDVATPILLPRCYFYLIALCLVEGGDEELKVPPVDGPQDAMVGVGLAEDIPRSDYRCRISKPGDPQVL